MRPTSGALQPIAKAIFSLYTLGCSSCSGQLERKLKKVPGILEVNVNYVADMVEIKFNPEEISTEDIRGFMKQIGYGVGKSPSAIL